MAIKDLIEQYGKMPQGVTAEERLGDIEGAAFRRIPELPADTPYQQSLSAIPTDDPKERLYGSLREKRKALMEADPLAEQTRRSQIANAVMSGIAGLGDIGAIPALANKIKPGTFGQVESKFGRTTPLYERLAEKIGRGGEPAGVGGKGGDSFKQEKALRDQFQKLTGSFRIIRDSYGRVIASAQDPSAAGDLALIFNYMKILDPGSVVRESEFANAQNAAGVPERVRTLYNNIINGAKLGPDQRKDFVRRANKLYKQQEKQYKSTEKEYTNLAGRYGLSPENVTIGTTYTREPMTADDKKALEWLKANKDSKDPVTMEKVKAGMYKLMVEGKI